MMLKVKQGLDLQQCPKHPGIFGRFLHGHKILNLTERRQQVSTWSIPLEFASIFEELKCREYLKAELSESMKNSNLINSDLSASGPSTLSKEWGEGGGSSRAQKKAKQRKI
jgi:hypothetical protein